MGVTAAAKAARAVANTRRILAIEAIAACQALEFLRPLETSPALRAAYARVRGTVPPYDTDRFLSPEIEAIYFDAGRGWKFKQDGQECAARVLDGHKNTVSHFIRSPVRRLQAKSWAEIKISGAKTLETRYGRKNQGIVFKDTYKIAGRAKVRLLTSEGAFDFPIDLDIDVDEFPF